MTTREAPTDAAGPAARRPFPYEGPEELYQTIHDALRRVVDPEVALSIVDVGLIYGVAVTSERVDVTMTMTSAACPVTESIVEEVEGELDQVVPPGLLIHVELVWEPPWTMERMSQSARRFMGW